MLIQGTNIPIQITFDSSVESFKQIVATLWQSNKEIARWTKDDMIVSGDTVKLPLNEDKTRNFKRGKAFLDIKGLNFFDQIVFWEEAEIEVVARNDRVVDLISEG